MRHTRTRPTAAAAAVAVSRWLHDDRSGLPYAAQIVFNPSEDESDWHLTTTGPDTHTQFNSCIAEMHRETAANSVSVQQSERLART